MCEEISVACLVDLSARAILEGSRSVSLSSAFTGFVRTPCQDVTFGLFSLGCRWMRELDWEASDDQVSVDLMVQEL